MQFLKNVTRLKKNRNKTCQDSKVRRHFEFLSWLRGQCHSDAESVDDPLYEGFLLNIILEGWPPVGVA